MPSWIPDAKFAPAALNSKGVGASPYVHQFANSMMQGQGPTPSPPQPAGQPTNLFGFGPNPAQQRPWQRFAQYTNRRMMGY